MLGALRQHRVHVPVGPEASVEAEAGQTINQPLCDRAVEIAAMHIDTPHKVENEQLELRAKGECRP